MPGGRLRRRVQLRAPHRHAPDRHGARRGRLLLRRRRQRLHRLVHRLRPHDLRPPPQAHPRLDRRPDHAGRHAVHVPARARLRGRAQDRPGGARHRPGALRQLRQRGDAGGHPPRPRLHRQGQDHEVGGELQRLPRLPRVLARAGARGGGHREVPAHAAVPGRHPQGRRRAPSSSRRSTTSTRSRCSSSATATSWPACSPSRSSATPASSRRCPASSRACAASATRTTWCSSSTRSSPASASRSAAPRSCTGSSPTSPASPRPSAAARRAPPRSAARRRSCSSRPTASCCTAAPTAATR